MSDRSEPIRALVTSRCRGLVGAGVATVLLVVAGVAYVLVDGRPGATLTNAGSPRGTSTPGPYSTTGAGTAQPSPGRPGASNASGGSATGGNGALGNLPAPVGQPASGGAPGDYPTAPTNLTATVVSDIVRLQWRDNSHNESGFHIGYSGPGGISSHFVGGGANATSFQFPEPAPPGWSACFAVRAFTTSGSFYFASAWSPGTHSSVCASIPSRPPPAAPSNVTAALINGGVAVRVTWQDNSNNEQAFAIHGAVDGQPMAWAPTASANVTEFAWTDVWAGPQFCFQVQALNYALAHSAWSSSACVSTAHLLPAPPSDLRVVEVLPDGTVRLAWTDNASNEDGFRIFREGTLGDRSVPANVTSYDWTGLPTGTQSCFTVRAFYAYAASSAARACTV